MLLLSAKNNNNNYSPKVFADSDDHKKLKCFIYSTVMFLKDPILMTVFSFLNFNPETDLNASKISMSSWNELNVPSNAKVASSANTRPQSHVYLNRREISFFAAA